MLNVTSQLGCFFVGDGGGMGKDTQRKIETLDMLMQRFIISVSLVYRDVKKGSYVKFCSVCILMP